MSRLGALVFVLLGACVFEHEEHHVIGWENRARDCSEASIQFRYSSHLGDPVYGLPCQASVDIAYDPYDPPEVVYVTTYTLSECRLFCTGTTRDKTGEGRASISLDEPSTSVVVLPD